MERIRSITARAIPDSRGNPTVEVVMRTGGKEAVVSVPSGKSAGSREAVELRDADGRGVSLVVENINTLIAPHLIGALPEVEMVDRTMIEIDGTPNKAKLGANATLGISLATARLAAQLEGVPLWRSIANRTHTAPSIPSLYMNMLNGGAHANFRLPFQEYIVVVDRGGARESYAKAKDIFSTLGTLVSAQYGTVEMGDEGGYSPILQGFEKPFELLKEAIGGESGATIAIDAAASEFYHEGKYLIEGVPYTGEGLRELYGTLVEKFHLRSIEDPFHESDFSMFTSLVRVLGDRTLVVGDDLTVTNPRIVEAMIEQKCANAMIIKPNQIGTLTEVFETVAIARKAGWRLIASHRSGETNDTSIADIAVGIGAYGLKAGAPTQEERRVKYERLIEIEQEMRSLQ